MQKEDDSFPFEMVFFRGWEGFLSLSFYESFGD